MIGDRIVALGRSWVTIVTKPIQERTRTPDDTIKAGITKTQIDNWLQTLGSTTFGGKGWDISDPKERPECVDWIHNTINNIIHHTERIQNES